jgi:hypothetical protein
VSWFFETVCTCYVSRDDRVESVARKQDKISGGKVVRSVHEFARFVKMHITVTFYIRQAFGPVGAD